MVTPAIRNATEIKYAKSQVFVEIPPSPLLNRLRLGAKGPKVDIQSNHRETLKENAAPTFSKLFMKNTVNSVKGDGKRKMKDVEEVGAPNSKKAKISLEVENNLITCHQCRSRKKPEAFLQCTSILKKTGKHCKASYCGSCLKIRYAIKLEVVKSGKSQDVNDPDKTYHFICPRCSDLCNCAPCRKKKGLAPTGKFSANAGASAREILERNPDASGILPKNALSAAKGPSKLANVNGAEPAVKTSKGTAVSQKGASKKPLPEPVWRSLSHIATKEEIEDRIYLREFILRFNPILSISHRNVEELDDFTSLHDQSTKAVLMALLDLIAVEDGSQKEKIQLMIKKIRGFGLNWSKIVDVLDELRDVVPKDHALHKLPIVDRSDNEAAYNVRTLRTQCLQVDRLFPVLLYLAEIVSVGESVRDELEEGMKEAKEVRSAYIKAQREEMERWSAEKAQYSEMMEEVKKQGHAVDATKANYKEAGRKHKSILSDIQNSHKPEMDLCRSRFKVLGTDMDGRTYYALSASGPKRGKKERVPSETERSKKWGWFIFVWGKPGTVVQQEDAIDEDEEDIDPDAERWWKFADVQDIRLLSQWLSRQVDMENDGHQIPLDLDKSSWKTVSTKTSIRRKSHSVLESADFELERFSRLSKSDTQKETKQDMKLDTKGGSRPDVDLSQPPSQAGVKSLAKSLLEFADFVEWRMSQE